MKALIIGSAVACGLGLGLGTNLRAGVHPDTAKIGEVAESFAPWSAPPADAAEPEPADVSPTLYVKWGSRWVTPAQRTAERAQAREDSYGAIPPPLQIPTAEPLGGRWDGQGGDQWGDPSGRQIRADAPPPPIVIGALDQTSLTANPNF